MPGPARAPWCTWCVGCGRWWKRTAEEDAADKEERGNGRRLEDGGRGAWGSGRKRGLAREVVVSGGPNERDGVGEQATSGGLD